MGPSGKIAQVFQDSKLTPLLAMLAILAGIMAIIITPKEEEPQIDVTMADIFVALPGASVSEVESLISIPAEQVMSEIEGIEHVYSVSRQGRAVITVQYKVGIPRNQALVRLYNKIYSNQDWLPRNLGASQPLIKPKGIDDVPIMTLTLFDPSNRLSGGELTKLSHALEVELKRIPGTRDIYTRGGIPDRVDVHIDLAMLKGYDLTIEDLRYALQSANDSSQEARITQAGISIPLKAGTLIDSVETLRQLVVGMKDGAAVFLEDVAEVSRGNSVPDQSVMMGFGLDADESWIGEAGDLYPAVTLAVAKKAGENAVEITEAIESRMKLLRNNILPAAVKVVITRDYGKTASDKARQLISDLLSATVSVILLVLAAMGWRQAVIVGCAVLITLLLTLVFSWGWGFTLNRVSLFALIFSIGILVDDGIVITENINRRIQSSRRSIREIIPLAVDEVGTPTIMASLTLMAALIPMAFVTGLMGPYMQPIPINASAGMVFSQIVAFIVAPWLALRLLRHKKTEQSEQEQESSNSASGVNDTILGVFRKLLAPFLGRHYWRRVFLAIVVIGLTLAAISLPVFQSVILKMLPFDNKSELQVIVDMDEDTPMEEIQRVLLEIGSYLETVEEVTHWQSYAGTSSPINFNGLVRQYYLREAPYLGDIQINLADKKARNRTSHEIALSLRSPLQNIGKRHGAVVKIVEVPPGPPVLSPVVAEVYGINQVQRAQIAERLAKEMSEVDGLVDIDTTLEAPIRRWEVEMDRDRAARLGIAQTQLVSALSMLVGGDNVSYLHDDNAKYAVPIRLILEEGDKAQQSRLMSLSLRSQSGHLVPISSFAEIREAEWSGARYHKDLLPVSYVTADMAGKVDSPLYGMFQMVERLKQQAGGPEQFFIRQPEILGDGALKWDGEWQITYETFRDMGLAYSVGIFMIFILLVAQFRSYLLPLVIMAPIPLTLIGIMPGHAFLGKEFTATSMIGMIALAGIIVRNSILVVVFIRQMIAEGVALEQAVILAGAVRVKPIALTAISAMVGAWFILDDPIFNGLAISLIFGLAASTLLTLLVVPLLYYVMAQRKWV